MLKKILLITLGISLSALPAYAASGDGGEAGAFLKMGAGARALSLGKAFVALADDATASYWNPAGLTQIKGHNLCLMYSEPFDKVDGIDYSLVSYAQPIPKGSIGISLIYLSADGLKKTLDSSGPTDDEFGDKETALLLSYATEIKQVMSVGATLKGISQEIDSDKDNGFGLDIGMLYRPTQLADLKVGLVFQDLIGADIRGNKMPLKLRLGVASYFFSDDRLYLSLGTDFTSDREVKGHFGAEYELLKSLLLRAGYSTDNEETTGGLGFKVRQFSIDCAYGSGDDLGGTYRVSLGVNF
ncbi:PorV/PorQ family protein [bacterium]|nr:PorV/PorQ family protein [bacterium]